MPMREPWPIRFHACAEHKRLLDAGRLHLRVAFLEPVTEGGGPPNALAPAPTGAMVTCNSVRLRTTGRARRPRNEPRELPAHVVHAGENHIRVSCSLSDERAERLTVVAMLVAAAQPADCVGCDETLREAQDRAGGLAGTWAAAAGREDGVAVVSLVCPYTRRRARVPGRYLGSYSPRVFDLDAALAWGTQAAVWRCPFTGLSSAAARLSYDPYFAAVLASLAVAGDECDAVELDARGRWRPAGSDAAFRDPAAEAEETGRARAGGPDAGGPDAGGTYADGPDADGPVAGWSDAGGTYADATIAGPDGLEDPAGWAEFLRAAAEGFGAPAAEGFGAPPPMASIEV
jgi:hypothetical protein